MLSPVLEPSASATAQAHAIEDNQWFWIIPQAGSNLPEELVPAVYRAGTNSWHSFGFGGLRTSSVKVICPLVKPQLSEVTLSTPAAKQSAASPADLH